MTKFLALGIALGFLIPNASFGSTESDATLKTSGIYVTPCISAGLTSAKATTIISSAGATTHIVSEFLDGKCSILENKVTLTGQAHFNSPETFPNGILFFDFNITGYSMVPGSTGAAKRLNDRSFCGLHNWALDVAQIVTGKTCAGTIKSARTVANFLAAKDDELITTTKLRHIRGQPGDANYDGCVTGADYTIWAANFGPNPVAPFTSGDFNGDGKVTGADNTIWAANSGKCVAQLKAN